MVVESLEQVLQRTCGCSICEALKARLDGALEQPDLASGNPADGREVGTMWPLSSPPTSPILGFYDQI